MNKLSMIVTALMLMTIVMLPAAQISAQPNVCSFYGNTTIDEANVPDGTIVEEDLFRMDHGWEPVFSAMQATTGSISGTVMNESGTPVVGANIYVAQYEDVGVGGTAYTATDGSYTITGLASGQYRVWVHTSGYPDEYYDNVFRYIDAIPVSVTAPFDTSGIDFVLEKGGSISGHVYESDGVTPIEGAQVLISHVNGGIAFGGPTNLNGYYIFHDIPAGEYTIRAEADGYVREYYDSVYSYGEATPVSVASEVQTSGTDFALDEGGVISGYVYQADGVTPLEGARVYAYVASELPLPVLGMESDDPVLDDEHRPELGIAPLEKAMTETSGFDAQVEAMEYVPCDIGPDGSYNIGGLRSGEYIVYAEASGYIREYYDGVHDWIDATRVSVTIGEETPDIDFALDQGGTISGYVSEADRISPVARAQVWANRIDGGGSGWAPTASDGSYVINGLPSGDYRVYVQADDFIWEYYDGVYVSYAATPVSVTAPDEISGINFALDHGGTISGHVYEADGITPVGGASVHAHRMEGEGFSWATTASDGSYVLDDLRSGDYRVEVQADGFIREYYDGVYDDDQAIPVLVTAPDETTGIDFALDIGGIISGHIYQADGVTPVTGASVYAYSVQEPISIPVPVIPVVENSTNVLNENPHEPEPLPAGLELSHSGGGSAGPDGSYIITGLQSGSYRIYVEADGYIREYYDGVYDLDDVTLVQVIAPDETTGIDFTLDSGGSISGYVYEPDGSTPIAGAWVQADLIGSDSSGSSHTEPDGSYTITGLRSGEYRVRCSAMDYLEEYYDDVYVRNQAMPVSVTAPNETVGIDFTLDTGGSISGIVTNADGVPISGAHVHASGEGVSSWGSAYTAPDGTYTITGLRSGAHRVQCDAEGYLWQLYRETYEWHGATLVPLTSPEEVTGIDFVLEAGGSISGVVVDADGVPISGAHVSASGCTDFASPPPLWGSADSTVDGSYIITDLYPGSYRVECQADGYIREYYQDAYGHSDSTPVSVIMGDETSNINFVLEAGGSIEGKVTDVDGNPIEGAAIYASGEGVPGGGITYSSSDGTYKIGGLHLGEYRVSCEADGHLREYYRDTYDWDLATLVSSTDSTAGIDFVLEVGGSISGTVTDPDGVPIEGAYVNASGSGVGYASTRTQTDGSYAITGLHPSDYHVSCHAEGYPREYYQDAADRDEATPVAVVDGNETPGIDFALNIGGSISGVIIDAAGSPIPGAIVLVNDNPQEPFPFPIPIPAGEAADISIHESQAESDVLSLSPVPQSMVSGSTNENGHYAITGLHTGDYEVTCYADGYITEYYDGAYRSSDATLVAVESPNAITGINFTLETGGSISGYVYQDDGITPVIGVSVYASMHDGENRESARTTMDGSFTISNLPSGSYQVYCRAYGYVTEYYQDSHTQAGATPVLVTNPNDTGGVVFTLDRSGRVSGHVYGEDGITPLTQGWIKAEWVEGGSVFQGYLDCAGGYTIRDLPAGTYRVSSDVPGYVMEYYDDAFNASDATVVSVIGAATTEDVDFVLIPLATGIVYVDDDAVGANNGSTWEHAFTDLQDALHVATAGAEIRVAAGTYIPSARTDLADPRTATFQLKKGVALYGGFDPSVGDTDPDDRDWIGNHTILSGDLHCDDDPEFANSEENAYHVVTGENLATLDGFMVTGGNADGAGENGEGGGMRNNDVSPAIINCTFSDNVALRGGGMFNSGGAPTVTRCVFSDNAASERGGAMWNQDSRPFITECTFTHNTAIADGGAIWNGSSPSLSESPEIGPMTAAGGGGILAPVSTSGTSAFWIHYVTYEDTTEVWTSKVNGEESIDGVDCLVIETLFDTNPLRYDAQMGFSLEQHDSIAWISGDTFDRKLSYERHEAMGIIDLVSATTYTYSTEEHGWPFYSVGTSYTMDVLTQLDPQILTPDYTHSISVEVVDSEEVIVPAGTYECFKVEYTLLAVDGESVDPELLKTEWWSVEDDFLAPVKAVNHASYQTEEVRELAVYSAAPAPVVTDCHFEGNVAGENGGAMANITSSPEVTNSVFADNRAQKGAAILNSESRPIVTNCTFQGNVAGEAGGGLFNTSGASAVVTNCILWGDSPDEIFDETINEIESLSIVTYSDVQVVAATYPGTGNINADPRLTSDFHLASDSPCIDSGDNSAPNLPDTDFEGDARIIDGNGDGTAVVDMGADEALSPIYVIIDNLDPEFSTNGSWTESGADDEYNGSSVYTATTGNTATWTPNLPEEGGYEVYAWWTYHYSGRDTNAPYTINHKNGSDTVRVDQNDLGIAGDWYLLGTYEFDAGIGGNVTLAREDGAVFTTSADVVRFVKTDCVINPLQITTTILASGQQDAYYYEEVNATGGVQPYTWSIISGSLSEGLSLNPATGIIDGTPTIEGLSNFTIGVSDSQTPPDTATQPLSITIDPPTPVEVTVDNLDPEFSTYGTWSESGASDEYNGSSVYTATTGNTATWTPNLPEAGCYEVYAWWTYHSSGRDTNAPYTINHKNGSDTVRVDQNDPAIAGNWYLLGTYEFNAGIGGNVTLTRENGAVFTTSADAVRFVKADCVINPVQITTTSLSSGQQDAYYYEEINVIGGVQPYTWSIISGSLSEGLSLNPATGIIDGTPTIEGLSNFTIGVSDSQTPPDTATQPLSITIDPPAPIEVTIDNLDPEFTTMGTWSESGASDEYNGSSVYTATTGNTATWTPNLPEAGCYEVYVWWTYHYSGRDNNAPYTINHKNGSDTVRVDQNDPAIAGDWYLLGTYEFNAGIGGNVTLTREDGAVFTTSADAVRFVKADCVINPLQITTTSLPSGQQDAYYYEEVNVTGGVQPYTWSIISGSLPDGLSLNPATGIIDGTPTIDGLSNFTIGVSDSQTPPDATTQPLSISINPLAPVEVTVDNLDSEFTTMGTWSESGASDEYNSSSVYTATTGNTATWTPNLPESGCFKVYAWWTYHSSGRDTNAPYTINHMSGSDTVRVNQNDPGIAGDWYLLGTYEFNAGIGGNVTLTREDGAVFTTSADAVRFVKADCVINPLQITTTILPSGQQDAYYYEEVNATGGVQPYTWSVISGSLPDGLSLNSATGIIDGTPTIDGLSNFTIGISDSQTPPDTATQPLSITIDPPAPVEVTVDNLDPEFITNGTWSESGANGEYNGSSVYTATTGNTATWTPNLPEAGCYEVYAWWTYHYSGRDNNAPYTINHKNGSDTVRVDQNDTATAGDWYLLGTYEFNVGIGGNVTLTREDGALGTTSADAVRFVRIGD